MVCYLEHLKVAYLPYIVFFLVSGAIDAAINEQHETRSDNAANSATEDSEVNARNTHSLTTSIYSVQETSSSSHVLPLRPQADELSSGSAAAPTVDASTIGFLMQPRSIPDPFAPDYQYVPSESNSRIEEEEVFSDYKSWELNNQIKQKANIINYQTYMRCLVGDMGKLIKPTFIANYMNSDSRGGIQLGACHSNRSVGVQDEWRQISGGDYSTSLTTPAPSNCRRGNRKLSSVTRESSTSWTEYHHRRSRRSRPSSARATGQTTPQLSLSFHSRFSALASLPTDESNILSTTTHVASTSIPPSNRRRTTVVSKRNRIVNSQPAIPDATNETDEDEQRGGYGFDTLLQKLFLIFTFLYLLFPWLQDRERGLRGNDEAKERHRR